MADAVAGNVPVPVTVFGPLGTLATRVHDLLNTGRYEQALAAADAYEALALAVGDEKTVSLLLQSRMYVYQQTERHEEALAAGHELIRRRRAAGQSVEEAKTLADLAWTLVLTGRLATAMRYLARSSILLEHAPSHDPRFLSALSSYCTTALTAELYEEADAGYARIVAASRAPGTPSVTSPYDLVRMEVLLRWAVRLDQLEEYGPAATRLRRVLAMARPWLDGYPHEDAMGMRVATYRALALAKLGAWDEAAAVAAPLVPVARALGLDDLARMVHLAYGIALRGRGELDAAARELLAAHQLLTPETPADERLFVAHERAVLALARTEPGSARAVLDALLEQGRQLWQLRLHRLAMLRQAIEHETLEAEHARTESALLRDPLTGLGNRLLFDHVVTSVDAGLRRVPTCLLVIDVDYFKAVNDTYSHTAGDRILCGVADILRANCRSEQDIPIRYAGDEFAVFLDVGLPEAVQIAHRIRTAVRSADLSLKPGVRVTVSTGVAQLLPGMAGQELFEAADEQLYRAKRAGRDRVCAAPTGTG